MEITRSTGYNAILRDFNNPDDLGIIIDLERKLHSYDNKSSAMEICRNYTPGINEGYFEGCPIWYIHDNGIKIFLIFRGSETAELLRIERGQVE